ncbi:MAG: sialidase family protein [Luteolibacter sp.]|uniref:sialidase family protein n=1 Tax=Luteolibacter sp. TaxID=1962973 RepID=UPI00326634B8
MKSLFIIVTLACAAFGSPPPPGVVIDHSPAASGQYIGSPSLCVLPNGDYLASHDVFGPATKEHEDATGRIFRSSDHGRTWKHLTDLKGFFWQNLFVHRGAVYAMGTNHHHGQLVIRRSTDNGETWTQPTDANSGLLAIGEWHTASVPVIESNGRLWRAVEDAMNGTKWGERYRARMASIAADADLLAAANWTISNPLARDPSWLGGKFGAWLEGNAVADPQGNIIDLLRVDIPDGSEKAAIVRISADGGTATFDRDKGFIDFPGGAKKFTVRKDPAGPGYWSLASIVPAGTALKPGDTPGSVRNTLALVYSADLVKWETRCILLRHPDIAKHGFQYVDWQFEGDDLIAACRTAWDDDEGGAHNNHDANFLTFHRWKNFRSLTSKDDVPMQESAAITTRGKGLSITGSNYEIARLENGETAFSNRAYRWEKLPDELIGKSFTRLAGGVDAVVEVTADADSTLVLATAPTLAGTNLGDWEKTRLVFRYTDPKKTAMQVFSHPLKKGATLKLPQGNWSGSMLIFEPEVSSPSK